jgi:hypothetical protein
MLPEGLAACLQPVRLAWTEKQLGCESFLRLVPPGPEVPRIAAVTDGIYVGAGRTISTGTIRVSLDAARRPEDLRVTLDGHPARRIAMVCTLPDIPRFAINFRLPPGGSAGRKQLEFRLGSRSLGTFEIVVAPQRFWWRNRLHPSELYQALRRRF